MYALLIKLSYCGLSHISCLVSFTCFL